jgi:hypothetical protein
MSIKLIPLFYNAVKILFYLVKIRLKFEIKT